jgi:hypothetical protein
MYSLVRHGIDSAKSPTRLVSGARARGQGVESRKLSVTTSVGKLEFAIISPSTGEERKGVNRGPEACQVTP